MSRILAFDTSGAWCAAAVLSEGAVTARAEEMMRGQAERLMPFLEEHLASAGLTWKDLDALAVGIGPGNFTGLRISVAAARGLSLGLGIPALGVSLFETTQDLSGSTQIAIPTTRGQAYFWDPDKVQTPRLVPLEQLGAAALSLEYGPAEHVTAMLHRAARKLAGGDKITPPIPLYIRPPDAAPTRDDGLRLL